MNKQYETREALERDIRIRAATDTDFRRDLLRDPKGTLSSMLGTTIPDRINVKVAIEGQRELCLSIPPALGVKELGALSDGDLDAVAGGCTPASAAATVAAGIWTSNIVGEIKKW